MIAFVSGKLISKSPAQAVIQVNGIGLMILIPLSSYQALGEIGTQTELYTHLHVREDALQLYGFYTKKERHVFKALITVSGIGPRTALGVLSGLTTDEFIHAVHQQDAGLIASAPGIGKKTAERLVLELKEKLEDVNTDQQDTVPCQKFKTTEEAVLALTALGFKPAKAKEMVRNEIKKQPDISIEDIIRNSLRKQ